MTRFLPNPVRSSAPQAGVDGRTTISRARAPLMTDGRIGDFFIDSVSKKLYGPKNAGAWPDLGLIKGDKGWSPTLAVANDNTRRVLRVVDWQGGEGTEPASGQYVGASGLVANIADAVDVRGEQGEGLPATLGAEGQFLGHDGDDAVWKAPAAVLADLGVDVALANRVRVDAVQAFTPAQAKQGRDNLLFTTDDITLQILRARSVPGFNGDDAPAINAALADKTAIRIRPDEGLGQLNLKTTVVALRPSTKIVMGGGMQSVKWVRDLAHMGDTLQMGSIDNGAAGAASCDIEDIFFVHPERLGFYDTHAAGAALTNKLTGGQSHLSVYGAQGGRAKIGGWGCQHVVSVFGGAGFELVQPFFIGGVWDPVYPQAQEAKSHVRFTYSPLWGHGTTHGVRNMVGYGSGPVPGTRRAKTLNGKTVQATWRPGPQFGILWNSCEDLQITGGFSSSFSRSNIGIMPITGGIIKNGLISDCFLDESEDYQIYSECSSAGLILDALKVHNTMFNGQMISIGAINISNAGGARSVARLDIKNCTTRAHLGGAISLSGVDGGRVRDVRMAGYNCARSDVGAGGSLAAYGLLVTGSSRNVTVGDCEYGGGINGDYETDSTDAYGMSPNATQGGYVDATTAQGNTYFRQRGRNFGLTGGSVVHSGTIDSAG